MNQLDLFIPTNDTRVIKKFAKLIEIVAWMGILHAIDYMPQDDLQVALNLGYQDALNEVYPMTKNPEYLRLLTHAVSCIGPEEIKITLRGTEFEGLLDRVIWVRDLVRQQVYPSIVEA